MQSTLQRGGHIAVRLWLHGRGQEVLYTQEVLRVIDWLDVNKLPFLTAAAWVSAENLWVRSKTCDEPGSLLSQWPPCLRALTFEKSSRNALRFRDLWVTLPSYDWLQNLFLEARLAEILGNDRHDFLNVIQDNAYQIWSTEFVRTATTDWIFTLCG